MRSTSPENSTRRLDMDIERAKAALEMTGQMKVHLLRCETPRMQDIPAPSSFAPGG